MAHSRERKRLISRCSPPALLFLVGVMVDRSHGFQLKESKPSSFNRLSSVGSWISGVTNSPPSQPLLTSDLGAALVSGTSLEDKELECVYKASEDGWSAIDFHERVDGKGSSLVVALSRSGQVFGGFNPLGWRSTDDYYSSNAAFLWFAQGNKPKKCPVLTGGKSELIVGLVFCSFISDFCLVYVYFTGNAAVFDYATGGPCFGAADLIIGEPKAAIMGGFAGPDVMDTSVNAGSLKEGRCSVGGTYNVDRATSWPVRGNFQLVQLEVYCNANVADISSGSGPSWWPF